MGTYINLKSASFWSSLALIITSVGAGYTQGVSWDVAAGGILIGLMGVGLRAAITKLESKLPQNIVPYIETALQQLLDKAAKDQVKPPDTSAPPVKTPAP